MAESRSQTEIFRKLLAWEGQKIFKTATRRLRRLVKSNLKSFYGESEYGYSCPIIDVFGRCL